MSAKLPAPAHDRFVKLCGLLTSDAAGERATAARMASDLLRQHKLSWAEVLNPQPCQPCPKCAGRAEQEERSRAYRAAAARDWTRDPWRNVAVHCLIHDDLLSEWEASFLQSVLRQRRQYLSDRQHEVLDRIADR